MLDSGLTIRHLRRNLLPDRSRELLDAPSSVKQKWTLTPEAFDALLSWLDADRDRAGERYVEIRSKLIKGFERHGCRDAESLADETMNRVARKLPEIRPTYEGDPARYFFGVAHNVHMEYLRKPAAVPLPPDGLLRASAMSSPDSLEDEDEQAYECLRICMGRLAPQEREMILSYYSGAGQSRIKLRKELAERLGVTLANLRLRAQRIRERLKGCLSGCMRGEVTA
jgi:DNA-directed RNA polymerase specialized sigma24 family protein